MLSVTLISAAALGADGPRTDINPALLYYQSFLLAPDPMSESDSDYLFSSEARNAPLPERFGKVFEGYNNQFMLVRQAAASTVPCDWGIDMTRGPATLLPHLARCKAVAQASRLRARWQLEHGQQAGARDDLLATFALARNTARDGTLISALVQIASEAIDYAVIADNFGSFTPETLKQLIAGLDALPPEGRVSSAMVAEKAYFHDWLVNRIHEVQRENPGNETKAMEQIHQLFGSMESEDKGQSETWNTIVQAAGGTSAGVLKLLANEQLLYNKLAEITSLPKAEFDAQMKQFEAGLSPAANPLISVSLGAYKKARYREFRSQVWQAMVRAAVEYKLNGEAGFQSVPDPMGNGPFEFSRFVFEGIDRGFQLKSAYTGSGFTETLIFVEKPGPGFRVDGPKAGEGLRHWAEKK